MLTLILAESALETIPENLWRYRCVKKHSKLRRKPPQFIILDRSYHHSAMRWLEQSEKRGRPDIIHFALLLALGSPLNKSGLLRVYVHTIDDHVIRVEPSIRLPRNYNRFISLIEQLFEYKKIPPESTKNELLTIERQTLAQLIHEIKHSYILAFSQIGRPSLLEEAMSRISGEKEPVALVGGFPHNSFSSTALGLANDVISIDLEMLETWTVTSRVIYEYERAVSLPLRRLNR